MVEFSSYMVGVIDAAGSFASWRRKGRHLPRFSLASKEVRLVGLLKEQLGCGKILIRRSRKVGHSPSYEFRIDNLEGLRRLVAFLDANPPLIRKREYDRFRKWVLSMNEKRTLDPDVVKKALRMYEEGLPIKSIISETGIKNVVSLARKEGIPRRRRRWNREELEKLLNSDYQIADLAEHYGVTKVHMKAVLRYYGLLS